MDEFCAKNANETNSRQGDVLRACVFRVSCLTTRKRNTSLCGLHSSPLLLKLQVAQEKEYLRGIKRRLDCLDLKKRKETHHPDPFEELKQSDEIFS